MMAGIQTNHRAQPRVEKVVIVHAGENLDTTIRPLAVILEKHLKLGEQVEYMRNFRAGTDVADYVLKSLRGEYPEEHTRLVIVISDTFVAKCATNQSAFQQIEKELSSRTAGNSKFAVVCPSDAPAHCTGLRCINLCIFIKDMESGNLAEAIYREWFGPQATLASQAQLSMQDLPLTSDAPQEFTPDKVKIIHAMTKPEDRQKYWDKISFAIEKVANPENTTQARLHFRQNSVAQTVLGDVEGFRKCAERKKINAVVIWCSNMLASLNQDPEAKTKVIEMLCNDIQPQKLFAHFLFGVDKHQMQQFSPGLWHFLCTYQHMAYIEASQLKAPNVDYTTYASIFLRSWAGELSRPARIPSGYRREPRGPEESADPTMTSLEDLSQITTNSGSTGHHSDQFHPQDGDQDGDHRLVINDSSVDHDEANSTQQTGKALRSADSSTKDRLLTNGESFHLGLMATANRSRELQSDRSSNPPGNLTLHDPNVLRREQGTFKGQQQQVLHAAQQPTPGSQGQNRMASGSICSVSVDSQFGPRHSNASGFANRGAVSLPPGSVPEPLASDQGMARTYQPASSDSSRANLGRNRCAPSGFQSHAINSVGSNASTTSQEPTSQAASGDMSSTGGNVSGTLRQGDSHLSLQQNPVRLSSDAAHSLDMELSRFTSVGFQSLGHQSTAEQDRASALTSYRHSFPPGHQSMPEQYSTPIIDTSHRMPEMSTASSIATADLHSVAEGVNPLLNDESSVPSAQAETDQEVPGLVLLSALPKPIIRGLEMRLDPIKSSISDWRDLASHFKVRSELITYWRGMMSAHGNCSPTESLIEWLKAKNMAVTVEDFKVALDKITRKDVLRYLNEEGY